MKPDGAVVGPGASGEIVEPAVDAELVGTSSMMTAMRISEQFPSTSAAT